MNAFNNNNINISKYHNIKQSDNISLTTDDSYLYIHSNKGISKIGTGLNNTSPGFLEGQLRGYRSSE